MPASLDDLLKLVDQISSGTTAERIAELVVRANSGADPHALAATIRGPLDFRITAKHACAASHVEQRPETLAAALAGPPMRLQAVLRRALRLQWFDRLAEIAPETRRSVGWNVPFDELKDWGRWAEAGCAKFCEAFGLRHPLLFDFIARHRGPDAIREQATLAWSVAADDWNGGRSGRPSVLPWAYGAIVEASAKAGLWGVADDLLAKIPGESAEYRQALHAVGTAAARCGAIDQAEQYLARLEEQGAEAKSVARDWGLVLFHRTGRDYPEFLDLARTSRHSSKDMIASIFWYTIEERDTATAAAVLLSLGTDQGFDRLEEQLNTWGGFLIAELSESGKYEAALEWCSRVLDPDSHRARAVRIAYLAALHGRPETARFDPAESER